MNANKQDAGGEVTNPDNVVGLDDVLTKWRAWLPLIGPDVARRVLETCIMDVGKLCRAAPAGMVLVPREIVANYRESTHIPRHRRICDSALAAPAGGDVCKTCQGHGMIGWTTGQTPEQFDQHEAPCPDCSAPAGSGEVEALASRLVSMSNGLHSAHLCTDLRRAAALLRKLQQGADYVMVPREPTSKMAALGAIAHKERGMAAAYRAMIAASQGQEGGTNG